MDRSARGSEEIWKDAGERGLTTEDFEGPRFVRLRQNSAARR